MDICVYLYYILSILGVLTRSKKASSGDRWTQTPLPVKLMKVLIAELRSQIEEEEDDDNDEDDEEVC